MYECTYVCVASSVYLPERQSEHARSVELDSVADTYVPAVQVVNVVHEIWFCVDEY